MSKYNYKVEYKGKVAQTNSFMELTDNECESIRTEYYVKPNIIC